jgi:mRNA interferase RelE/StbE
MSYALNITPSAEKDIRKLPIVVQDKVFERLQELILDPRQHNSKKLKDFNILGLDFNEYYRTRMGNYRIIYGIEDINITVVVVKVGHRKYIYRKK